jgi:hypothetical protein
VNRWTKAYWYDLADNVLDNIGIEQLWPVLILPTLVSLIKGLLANMVEPRSGASMLPSPPGPIEVNRTRDEAGVRGLDGLGYVLAGIGIILILVDLLAVVAGFIWPGLIFLIAGVVTVVLGRNHTPH